MKCFFVLYLGGRVLIGCILVEIKRILTTSWSFVAWKRFFNSFTNVVEFCDCEEDGEVSRHNS